MSKFVILTILLIGLILVVDNVKAAAEQGADCYEKDLKISVKRGEVAYPKGKCMRLKCSDSGVLSAEPCELGIPPKCKVIDGDLSKQYPSCCPTLKCEK